MAILDSGNTVKHTENNSYHELITHPSYGLSKSKLYTLNPLLLSETPEEDTQIG